jgi:hypothetical protein
VRRVQCRRCGAVKREKLEFLLENALHTQRFARYVAQRDFAKVFLDELQQQESLLNLERYCHRGGFPDLETTNLEVSKVEGDADDVVVHVKCGFDESAPTSCGGVSFPYPTLAEFTIALSAGDEGGDVEYLLVMTSQSFGHVDRPSTGSQMHMRVSAADRQRSAWPAFLDHTCRALALYPRRCRDR